MTRALRSCTGLRSALPTLPAAVAAQEMPGATPLSKAATTRASTFTLVPPEAFFTALPAVPDITLINNSRPLKGKRPGTDAFIAFDLKERQRNRLPQNKAAAIAVYCVSGHMLEVASRTLHNLGYPRVTELRGA